MSNVTCGQKRKDVWHRQTYPEVFPKVSNEKKKQWSYKIVNHSYLFIYISLYSMCFLRVGHAAATKRSDIILESASVVDVEMSKNQTEKG